MFPEKKLRSLVHNFNIHVSASDFYIPTIGPSILLQPKEKEQSWEYINRSQKHECRNWQRGRAVSLQVDDNKKKFIPPLAIDTEFFYGVFSNPCTM
jgi:NOL1/NOP2/fmu family ribosome biogenesis protein